MNVKLFFFLFLLTGCAYIIEKVDPNFKQRKDVTLTPVIEKTYCEKKESFVQILSENKKNHLNFKDFLSTVKVIRKLEFIDKVVLWSLIQMNLRPDLSAPNAKLMVSIRYRGKDYFYNFFSKDIDDMTYLFALEDLLKKFKSKNTLLSLAESIDKHYNNKLYISESFARFLKKNKISINTNKKKDIYLRGDETLKENEKVSKINFQKLVIDFKRSKNKFKNITHSDFLFSYKISKNLEANCNYDMGLYKNSIFLISEKKVKTNMFGLKVGQNIFIASSTQNLNNINIKNDSIFFQGTDDSRPAAFCNLNHRSSNKTIWLLSSEQRDPGQHIYHLFDIGLKNIKSINDLNRIKKTARYLFLQSPTRLMFESSRGNSEQLSQLLKLNLPIYYAKNLGKVWSFYEDQNNKSFILDDRLKGGLSCLKQ